MPDTDPAAEKARTVTVPVMAPEMMGTVPRMAQGTVPDPPKANNSAILKLPFPYRFELSLRARTARFDSFFLAFV